MIMMAEICMSIDFEKKAGQIRGAGAVVLPRFSSGLFRAMFAMKERTNGKEIHR